MASILFIHVGQCGNQVGLEFWDLLSKQFPSQTTSKNDIVRPTQLSQFFDYNSNPNAILLDTEPKVIASVRKKGSKNGLSFRNYIVEQSGCGNNWALGYTNGGTIRGRHQETNALDSDQDRLSLVEQALQMIEKRIGMMDYLDSIIVTASLSGGTGSGVGSRLVQSIREKYGFSIPIIVIAVAAFLDGDTTLQYYNTLLSLSHFQRYSDAVLLFHNSEITRILNSKKGGQDSVSTNDINQYIAASLVTMLLPTKEKDGKYQYFNAQSIITQLAPMKLLNILDMHTSAITMKVNQTMTSWQYIAENFVKTVPIFDYRNRPAININLKTIVRGKNIMPLDKKAISSVIDKHFKKPSWFYNQEKDNFEILFISGQKALPGSKIDNCITTIGLRSTLVEYLNLILTKVYLMMEVGAYLKHYERYGCTREMFQSSFDQIQETILKYCEYTQ